MNPYAVTCSWICSKFCKLNRDTGETYIGARFKATGLNTNARSMSNTWCKRMALILCDQHSCWRPVPVHTGKPPTFLPNQMQTLLKMLPRGSFTPNLETEWKHTLWKGKKKNNKKTPSSHLHMHSHLESRFLVKAALWCQTHRENPRVAFLVFLKWHIPRGERWPQAEVHRRCPNLVPLWSSLAGKPEAVWNSRKKAENSFVLWLGKALVQGGWFQLGLSSKNGAMHSGTSSK